MDEKKSTRHGPDGATADLSPSDRSSSSSPTSPSPTPARSPTDVDAHHPTKVEGAEIGSTRDGKLTRWLKRLGDLPEYGLGSRGKLQGPPLNWAIGIIASIGFFSFGYDQGVLGSLVTLDDFQRSIPLMTPFTTFNAVCFIGDPADGVRDPANCRGDPNTQAAAIAVYQIGCFLGSLLVLFYGDAWGRRSSTFWASWVMIIGTVFQAAATEPASYALMIVGRVIGGVGNGIVTSTIPTWQSECAKPAQRGILILLSGCLIAGGIAISYWVDYGFYFLEGTVRWRFPIAFQSFFTLIVIAGILWLPDSPRWLLMRGRTDEARDVIARFAGLPEDDERVEAEMHSIQEALHVQNAGGGFRLRELLTNGPSQNLRRLIIACLAQFFQQIGGINLVTYYATLLFEDSLGFSPDMSRLLAAANGTEYFLAALVALPLVERTGRRTLMIVGAAGMAGSMAVLAGMVSTGTQGPEGAPILDTAPGVVATVFLFVFNSFFALGWLGMTWLYPAEISSLRTRISVNALSTSTNWLSNFLIVMITPPGLASLGWRIYIMFAVFNAAIIPAVFLLFPETRSRSLEEIDLGFASAHAKRISPVRESLKMPRYEGRQLDAKLAEYFGGSRPAAVETGAAPSGVEQTASKA
ncbi:uncharacterized protein PFL1_02971 [Pseudozyma flocculosa PF-1]|uniref:Major facilitator superfamily (MFS) profile domain-containing protein n=2 Tax=Pseudozyma flocculosa TaxID=84751 RepID=A0A061HA21_9BASI|nr:uncharacterized protein PFL1_02971 [Pseudozyma flocculosa PF-1]EPQ29752.1 hypothetical protein PFL1_02971 [Pseudozyma flocculosa PF-1]SPO38334.1 probable transporter (major facilitator superfamily) [Pseudozyma flocculosa]